MTRPTPSSMLALLLLPLGLAACTSTTYSLRFTPSPAEVVVPADDSDAALARVLVSVLDAKRRDGQKSQPFELHLRMRVENLGEQDLTMDAGKMLLVDADLRPLATPRMTVNQPDGHLVELPQATIPPGDARVYDLRFPLMHVQDISDLNLSGLNLRWTLAAGDIAVLLGATFSRSRTTYVYPYYDPFYGYPYPSAYFHGYYHCR